MYTQIDTLTLSRQLTEINNAGSLCKISQQFMYIHIRSYDDKSYLANETKYDCYNLYKLYVCLSKVCINILLF